MLVSWERAVRAVRWSLPALVTTFEEIFDETGDAEAHGIASLSSKYNTVACIYMLSDVLHTVAKLQGTSSSQCVWNGRKHSQAIEGVGRRHRYHYMHGLKTTSLCSLTLHNLEEEISMSKTPWKLTSSKTCIALTYRVLSIISEVE